VGWTSIYLPAMTWGSLGTRVLTHPHFMVESFYIWWSNIYTLKKYIKNLWFPETKPLSLQKFTWEQWKAMMLQVAQGGGTARCWWMVRTNRRSNELSFHSHVFIVCFWVSKGNYDWPMANSFWDSSRSRAWCSEIGEHTTLRTSFCRYGFVLKRMVYP